jgi:hypothetical protein
MIPAQQWTRKAGLNAWLCCLTTWACAHDAPGDQARAEQTLAASASAPVVMPTVAPEPVATAVVVAGAQEADDSGSCARFYYGHGVTADKGRARRCFERAVAREHGCGAAPPSLDRFFLATMVLGGQGGPIDRERARALLADCPSDVTILTLRGLEPGDAQGDPCVGVAVTSSALELCAAAQQSGAELEAARLSAALRPRLSRKAVLAWHAAEELFATYVRLAASAAGDRYRDGSLQAQTERAQRIGLLQSRNALLAELLTERRHARAPLPSAELQARLARARDEARAAARDDQGRELLARAERTHAALERADAAWLAEFTEAERDAHFARSLAAHVEALRDHSSL